MNEPVRIDVAKLQRLLAERIRRADAVKESIDRMRETRKRIAEIDECDATRQRKALQSLRKEELRAEEECKRAENRFVEMDFVNRAVDYARRQGYSVDATTGMVWK